MKQTNKKTPMNNQGNFYSHAPHHFLNRTVWFVIFLFDWVLVNSITISAYVALLPLAIRQMRPTNQALSHKYIFPVYCNRHKEIRFI